MYICFIKNLLILLFNLSVALLYEKCLKNTLNFNKEPNPF
jgi:hypothetical protein